jgi:hypothetical protein
MVFETAEEEKSRPSMPTQHEAGTSSPGMTAPSEITLFRFRPKATAWRCTHSGRVLSRQRAAKLRPIAEWLCNTGVVTDRKVPGVA